MDREPGIEAPSPLLRFLENVKRSTVTPSSLFISLAHGSMHGDMEASMQPGHLSSCWLCCVWAGPSIGPV